jgi:phosphoribosylanthranilate isomerase
MSIRVKICGVTRAEDARAAADAGASAIGMVFWPGSARCVTIERAREIAAAVAGTGITTVGVFVDQTPQFVKDVVRTARLHAIQLHGHESVGAYEIGVPILKAFAVSAAWHAGMLADLPGHVLPLLDANDDRRKGGTGSMIDWTMAASAASVRRIALAGGLTPENVSRAIATASPYAVDVSSGVEARPGIKDGRRVRAFVEAVVAHSGAAPRSLFE